MDSGEQLHHRQLKIQKFYSMESVSTYMLPIHALHIRSTHNDERHFHRYRPVSSIGALANGELYYIYRFLLFCDAFEMFSGLQASAEGFYILAFNIQPNLRSLPSAVHILTLAPPGCNNEAIFKSIRDDVICGMTEGYADIDANGSQCRIFLDLQ